MRAIFLCITLSGVFSDLAAGGNPGVPPRPGPSDYPVRQSAKTSTIAAAIVPSDQVGKMFSPEIAKQYIVVEVAVYPEASATVDVKPLLFMLRVGNRIGAAESTSHAALVVPMRGSIHSPVSARQGRRLTPLEWLSLATAVIATVAVTAYSAFFYHYADFPAPWLALALGGAAGALAGHRRWSIVAIRVFAVLVVLVTVLQVREMYPLRRSGAETLAAQIPASACIVTDEASLTIAADRFANLPAGCPDIIDSLAATLVLSNGVSVQGGAQNMPAVVAQWKTWLGKADYVLLSPAHASQRRIPWTPALWSWFKAEFVVDGKYSPATGQLYQRVNYTPPAGFTPAS